MEELRVPVDYVVGTSMGSIVGGLYCAGLSPEEMESMLTQIDWESAFRNSPERRRISFRRKEDDDLALFPFEIGVGKRGMHTKAGITAASKIAFILRGLTLHAAGVQDFDRLRLPYRAVAADLRNGEAVILDHGDLARAMRASMSIPGVFTPVEIEGHVLVDGGIALNMPVDVARELGADRIIAIDVGTPPKEDVTGLSAVGVLSQTMSVLSEHNVEQQRRRIGAGDLLISPNLDHVTSGDFPKIDLAITAGETAAREQAAQLREFSVSEPEFAEFLRRQRRGPEALVPSFTIDAVEVEVRGSSESVLDPALLARRMQTRPGDTFDIDVVYKDLERVSQAGEIESVEFRLDETEDHETLVLEVKQKSWGPGYLKFGLAVESDLEGDSDFRAIAHYRRPGLNRLGAEWKTIVALGSPTNLSTEFFQPLDRAGFWFVAPRLGFDQDKEETFLADGDLESFRTRVYTGALDFGVQFRNWAEIRVGALAGKLDLDPVTASAVEPQRPDLGAGRLKITLDQIDNAFFPRQGNVSLLELLLSRDTLGADDEYDKLFVSTAQSWTWGKNTFVGRIQFGTDLGSEMPVYDQFEIGGFLNISGLQPGQIRGEVMTQFLLGDYWRIGGLGGLGRLYLGGVIEAGNAWPDADEVELSDLVHSQSIFFGVDNPLAPVYLGVGLADGGQRQFYLSIGRFF